MFNTWILEPTELEGEARIKLNLAKMFESHWRVKFVPRGNLKVVLSKYISWELMGPGNNAVISKFRFYYISLSPPSFFPQRLTRNSLWQA